MPVFDQGYQHWQGQLHSSAWTWLAIMNHGVRQQLRMKRTIGLVLIAFIPALFLAAALIMWGLLEQRSSWLQPLMMFVLKLPDPMQANPIAYRVSVWTLAFNMFLWFETFFSMLLVLIVGPNLISQDLRFNALPLYLSRPITRFDYFLGKLAVIAFFLGGVMIAPILAAYLVGVLFSLDISVVRDTWRVLLGSLAYGLVIVLSAGMLMLAFSSLSRSSRIVGAMWLSLWILGDGSSFVLKETVRQEWCPLISYSTNQATLREKFLDAPTSRQKYLDVIMPNMPNMPKRRSGRRHQHMPTANLGIDHPWQWSAGVMAGLFVASIVVLSTRVRSLDRLK